MPEWAEGNGVIGGVVYKIIEGDCIEVMKTMEENSVDAIVTDPPYEIAFMGRKWDNSGIAYSVEMWKEALRVLKPGGHLLSFGSTRTYHRMVCAIEDAGFECRDTICYMFGSGFPKSLNVSIAIDKVAGAEREVIGPRTSGDGRTRNLEPAGGQPRTALHGGGIKVRSEIDTAPSTEVAKKYEGFGTALKPAMELICMARKPLIGRVVDNVLRYDTGALNIDACRINPGEIIGGGGNGRASIPNGFGSGLTKDVGSRPKVEPHSEGRWPSNVILDGSDEVVSLFPQTKSGQPCGVKKATNNIFGEYGTGYPITGFGDSGSAARFFYTAKADKAEREIGCYDLDKKVYNIKDGIPQSVIDAIKKVIGETI